MKKKVILAVCILLLLLLGGFFWHRSTYIQIESETLRRDITRLEVTGEQVPDTAVLQQLTALEILDVRSIPLSIAQYESLKEALPNCRILWNVPFQGSYLSEDTAELSILTLSEEDFASIAYLPSLKTVNADGCSDYDLLMQLKAQYPRLEIHYTVTIQGVSYDENTTTLTVSDAAGLDRVISYLPNLQQVTFTETAADPDAIYQLVTDYPQVVFLWNLTVFGIEMPNTATELILSGIPMQDTTEVESYLKYFPDLKRVEMCDCGISSEEMDALSKRWPEIRFVWTINIGFGKVRTDITAFMPMHLGYTKAFPFSDKDCVDLKYCVDLVCLDLGHMRVNDLSFLSYMPNLKYLIVADIPCQDFSVLTQLKDLIYLEIFFTKFTDLEILLELPNLQDLNISYTPVDDIEVFKQMTWLKRLWVAGTAISNDEFTELSNTLSDTKVVMFIDHATAGGWRNHQNYFDMRDLLGAGYMSE